MHSAPSVSYPAGRSRFCGAMLLLLAVLAVAAVAAWTVLVDAPQWRQVAAWAATALVLLLAAIGWWRSPEGELAWDGQAWWWTARGRAAAAPGRPELALDLQRHLLLRWRGEGRLHWLWLQREAQPRLWDDLRRAVYSRARPQAPRG